MPIRSALIGASPRGSCRHEGHVIDPGRSSNFVPELIASRSPQHDLQQFVSGPVTIFTFLFRPILRATRWAWNARDFPAVRRRGYRNVIPLSVVKSSVRKKALKR